MVLTVFAIDKAKPREKPYKLSDGNGLALLVQPNGSKFWRFRYRFGGKENMLTFGSFPEITLASARRKRDDARRLVAEGIDPAQQRKAEKAAETAVAENTFGVVAGEYLEKLKEEGSAASTIEKNRWLLEDLAKPLALHPIADIKPAEILDLLKRIGVKIRPHARHLKSWTVSSFFLRVPFFVTLRLSQCGQRSGSLMRAEGIGSIISHAVGCASRVCCGYATP